MHKHPRHLRSVSSRRSGFTLVELLVVVTVVLILAGVTVATLNFTANADRIPEGARSTQSYLEGARDRAIYRHSPVGVRLILDANGPLNAAGNPTTVSSLAYVATPKVFAGQISIDSEDRRTVILFLEPTAGGDGEPGEPLPAAPAARDDDGDGLFYDTNDMQLASGTAPNSDDVNADPSNLWMKYKALGLLSTGVQISLSKGATLPLTFTLVKTADEDTNNNGRADGGEMDTNGNGRIDATWQLSSDYPAPNTPDGPGVFNSYTNIDFEITLRPALLPNQDQRELPRGVVIDLEAARLQNKLPPNWYDSTNNRYSNYMDILFSPRGIGIGPSSGFGLIHLPVADVADIERTDYTAAMATFFQLSTRQNSGLERVVTVNPSTGNITVAPLDLTDGDANDYPDDPFRFAETGEVSP